MNCILENTSVLPSSNFVDFIHRASRICLGQSAKALVCTVGQITIFLDINRIRHKMVKNAIKVGNIRRKTSLGQNFFA